MDETCCEAYNDLGTIPMEQWLYDENHFPVVDTQIYYFIFSCGGLP
jgi:hypothetical protein